MSAPPNEPIALTRLLFLIKKTHDDLSNSLLDLERMKLAGTSLPTSILLGLITSQVKVMENFMEDYLVEFTSYIEKIQARKKD